MSEGRVSWRHVGSRILGNPFESKISREINGNPFGTFAEEWCSHCRLVVDTDTEAEHRNGIYVYKRTCNRCGRAIKWGVYQAPLVSDRPLVAKAIQFVTSPAQDRR